MVIKTKFMTVRPEDLSAVGKDVKGTIYLLFKSGATHSIVYNEGSSDFEKDYERLESAMDNKGSVLDFPEKTEKS